MTDANAAPQIPGSAATDVADPSSWLENTTLESAEREGLFREAGRLDPSWLEEALNESQPRIDPMEANYILIALGSALDDLDQGAPIDIPAVQEQVTRLLFGAGRDRPVRGDDALKVAAFLSELEREQETQQELDRHFERVREVFQTYSPADQFMERLEQAHSDISYPSLRTIDSDGLESHISSTIEYSAAVGTRPTAEQIDTLSRYCNRLRARSDDLDRRYELTGSEQPATPTGQVIHFKQPGSEEAPSAQDVVDQYREIRERLDDILDGIKYPKQFTPDEIEGFKAQVKELFDNAIQAIGEGKFQPQQFNSDLNDLIVQQHPKEDGPVSLVHPGGRRRNGVPALIKHGLKFGRLAREDGKTVPEEKPAKSTESTETREPKEGDRTSPETTSSEEAQTETDPSKGLTAEGSLIEEVHALTVAVVALTAEVRKLRESNEAGNEKTDALVVQAREIHKDNAALIVQVKELKAKGFKEGASPDSPEKQAHTGLMQEAELEKLRESYGETPYLWAEDVDFKQLVEDASLETYLATIRKLLLRNEVDIPEFKEGRNRKLIEALENGDGLSCHIESLRTGKKEDELDKIRYDILSVDELRSVSGEITNESRVHLIKHALLQMVNQAGGPYTNYAPLGNAPVPLNPLSGHRTLARLCRNGEPEVHDNSNKDGSIIETYDSQGNVTLLDRVCTGILSRMKGESVVPESAEQFVVVEAKWSPMHSPGSFVSGKQRLLMLDPERFGREGEEDLTDSSPQDLSQFVRLYPDLDPMLKGALEIRAVAPSTYPVVTVSIEDVREDRRAAYEDQLESGDGEVDALYTDLTNEAMREFSTSNGSSLVVMLPDTAPADWNPDYRAELQDKEENSLIGLLSVAFGQDQNHRSEHARLRNMHGRSDEKVTAELLGVLASGRAGEFDSLRELSEEVVGRALEAGSVGPELLLEFREDLIRAELVEEILGREYRRGILANVEEDLLCEAGSIGARFDGAPGSVPESYQSIAGKDLTDSVLAERLLGRSWMDDPGIRLGLINCFEDEARTYEGDGHPGKAAKTKLGELDQAGRLQWIPARAA